LLALLPLLAAPVAQAEATSFCKAFQPVLDAATEGFSAVRGESLGNDEWRATLAVPDTTDCQVYQTTETPARMRYTCRMTLAGNTDGPAAAAYTEAVRGCAVMSTFGLFERVWYLKTQMTGVQVSLIQFDQPEPYINLVVYQADD
ncbi:hypothetical protein, partial [Asticcacaulis biprosthecium]|uniref:hypothetical protein n=1 Tax=Asticcacaulis biprosthecium TaxID=76891 RepID=UPI00058C40E2